MFQTHPWLLDEPDMSDDQDAESSNATILYVRSLFAIVSSGSVLRKCTKVQPVQQFSEPVCVSLFRTLPYIFQSFGNDQFFPKCFNDEQDGEKVTCRRPQCESGSRGSSAST